MILLVRSRPQISWARLPSDLDRIEPNRLSETAGVAGLYREFWDRESAQNGLKTDARC